MKKLSKLAILSISTLLLCGCTQSPLPPSNSESEDIESETSGSESEDDMKTYTINPVSPLDKGVTSLAHDDITEFANNFTYTGSKQYVRDYNHYASKPLTLEWTCEEEAIYYLVELSLNTDLSESKTYLCNSTTLEVDDAKPGYTYYWRVNAYLSDKIIRSKIFTFETQQIPYTYYMESVGNFRDMGGFKTIDNKRVKHGLAFRGANPDSINQEDRDFLLNELKIKSEIDLRNKGEGKRGTNVIGVDNYYVVDDNGGFLYSDYPNGVVYETGRQVLAREIKLFANRDNYPIYYHCAIGRDRTGCLALVLNCLLGVEKMSIALDYEMSLFAYVSTRDIATNPNQVDDMVNAVFYIYNYIYGGYSGANMQKRTEAFLLDIGVTQEEIDTIRDVMLEDIK